MSEIPSEALTDRTLCDNLEVFFVSEAQSHQPPHKPAHVSSNRRLLLRLGRGLVQSGGVPIVGLPDSPTCVCQGSADLPAPPRTVEISPVVCRRAAALAVPHASSPPRPAPLPTHLNTFASHAPSPPTQLPPRLVAGVATLLPPPRPQSLGIGV